MVSKDSLPSFFSGDESIRDGGSGRRDSILGAAAMNLEFWLISQRQKLNIGVLLFAEFVVIQVIWP